MKHHRLCQSLRCLFFAAALASCAGTPAAPSAPSSSARTVLPAATVLPNAPISAAIHGITNSFTASDPFVQNKRLGRGVNLGNMLEAPKGVNWGLTARDEYFQLIHAAGFTAVRVPIRWSDYAAPSAPYTIEPAFFAQIDHVVQQALGNQLVAIINVHHYDAMMTDPGSNTARFLAIWQQIAVHYQAYAGDLLFEPLNEPNGALSGPVLNLLYAQVLTTIRASNPTRNIVVGPMNWNAIDGLDDLELPAGDQHLIVTFHYYNPFHFTHQGADWVEGSDAWLGTTWDGSTFEQSNVANDLSLAASWGRRHKRPIYMGEFGAYSSADMASRARWMAVVAREAEQRNMSWTYWEFGAGFGVYDPAAKQWRAALLAALVPKS